MHDSSSGATVSTAIPNGSTNSEAGVKQIEDLLSAKDDTSRFVGLALLKSVLDNQLSVREDASQITKLWESISPKFLDRLLRAGQSAQRSKDEAQSMVDIAVAVLHTFASLLPEDQKNDERLLGRTNALVNALLESSADTTTLILQTLVTFASYRLGIQELLRLEDLSPLIEVAPEQPLVLKIFELTWSGAAVERTELDAVRYKIDELMSKLLVTFRDTDGVTLFIFIGETFPKLVPEIIPENPSWLSPLAELLKRLVVKRPTIAGRAAYTEATAVLLHVYPAEFPPLIFGGNEHSTDSKPFTYLFINLLVVDIRSSFPSLLTNLNNPEYPSISRRLAGAFDVISSFIGYLVRSLDDDEAQESSNVSNMPPDLLLRLRKEIAETMSLNIEYLRDRWDASVAGAAGLHPSARAGTAATSEGTRLTLTWESLNDRVQEDHLVLAAIRALAIWLREDENEKLHAESAGLIDMLVELYLASMHNNLDFRYPILTILEVVLGTEQGVNDFLNLHQNGWDILAEDLISILQVATLKELPAISLQGEVSRGIEIIRILLAVVEHESTTEPREEWMKLVNMAGSINHKAGIIDPLLIELEIAILQLAAALLTLASVGMRKRYIASTTAIIGLAEQLRSDVRQIIGPLRREFQESLDDVLLDLENLR